MKKVLLTGVALLIAGGTVAPAFAADAVPGITITGDARARYAYRSEEYFTTFGNTKGAANSQTNMDSRVRFNLTGMSAGGSYIKGRIRLMDNSMGDMSSDISEINALRQNNLWADLAYFGIPFTKEITMEAGKYRSTYGPVGPANNFFYDDVNLTGAKGIVKIGDIEVNPFFEYVREGNNLTTSGSSDNNTITATNDQLRDHDAIRMGAHGKVKINKAWTAGGMLGYQTDQRDEAAINTVGNTVAATAYAAAYQRDIYPNGITKNEGVFGTVYVNGKVDQFGLVGELSYTAAKLNGFNNWQEDNNNNPSYTYAGVTSTVPTASYTNIDMIGSKNDGFGGYVFPNYTMDKLNIGLNLGFTSNGFMPDRAFGFVMLGATDNSVITAKQIGQDGNWFWIGLVPSYQISDSLKLTGNLVYANIGSNWSETNDGPGFVKSINQRSLTSAWELSAVMQYTISKGANVFFAAGYLDPSLKYVNETAAATSMKDDATLGAYTRFELAF